MGGGFVDLDIILPDFSFLGFIIIHVAVIVFAVSETHVQEFPALTGHMRL